jgi:macrolide transport system ATP-binding/permease protein
MIWLRVFIHRLLGIFFKRGRERDLDEEIRSHLGMQVEENMRQGMSAEEARRAARLKIGGITQVKEVYRDRSSLPLVESILQDLRYAVRTLKKSPSFTIVTVLILALGIGANSAIFSLVDSVLLKMLPVKEPGQLYFISNVAPNIGANLGIAPPYPCFERFQNQNHSFTDLAAFSGFNPKLKIDGQLEEVRGQRVSWNYFSLLGVPALLGRTLTPADDSVLGHGGPDGVVAVISYNYWTGRFGQSPAVIGKKVQLGNRLVTIIGVTPPDFYGLFPGSEIDVSLPITVAGAEMIPQKTSTWFRAFGRLKTGIPVEQARVELNTLFQTYLDELQMNAEWRRENFARIELVSASKGLDTLRRQFSRPLQILMFIVAMVLLIACANVANLLLVRGTARRKEFAVRLALGASRLRLLRQMGAETFLLLASGGLLGLLIARWGAAFLMSYFGAGPNRLVVNLPLDYHVLLFTSGLALLTGSIFGLAPALKATSIDPNLALKASPGASTSSHSRFGKALVVVQVASSLLLLAGAGLFLRTLHNLKNLDAGFQPEGVLTIRVNPEDTVYQGAHLTNLWKDVLARVERLPGVRSASLSSLSPLDRNSRGVMIEVTGFTPRSQRDQNIRLSQVSPRYFQTFGTALLQGRGFTDADNERSPKVALFNEAAARFYFGDRSPLGEQIRFDYDPRYQQPPPPYEIVGVVKDSRYKNLREPDERRIYLPISQPFDGLGGLTLAVRAEGKPVELINAISNELHAAGSGILLTNIATLSERVDQSLLQERLVVTLSLIFSLLALLLASVGLYGVMAYDVARRTTEIGIRTALGASARQVEWLVLRETLWLVGIGVMIGLGAALGATRLIQSLLFDVQPHDPLTIGLAVLVLLAVGAVAGYLPARRASRVDPMVALRHD